MIERIVHLRQAPGKKTAFVRPRSPGEARQMGPATGCWRHGVMKLYVDSRGNEDRDQKPLRVFVLYLRPSLRRGRRAEPVSQHLYSCPDPGRSLWTAAESRSGPVAPPPPSFGWRYSSNTTCLMQPRLFYALFIVSRSTIICYITYHF